MAKKQNNIPSAIIKKAEQNLPSEPPVEKAAVPSKPLSILDFKVQAWIVALLAFVFYANSYMNENAHDDGIVIVKNEYVQEGFAGLKGIFTKDAYDSYYRQLNTVNQLAGGRYRPLSIATFAIEQEFFGTIPVDKVDSFLKRGFTYGFTGPEEKKMASNMHVRHLFNVFWYMACVVVLLYFLRYIVFRDNHLMALIATLLFTIHPIHTEVVANVKSRDEIMSLMFMCLTFIMAFKHDEEKKPGYLFAALGCFFLAFLSKEYALTMLILLPMSFYLFRGYSLQKSAMTIVPYLGVFILYIIIRVRVAMQPDQTFADYISAVREGNPNSEKEVLNNPYYFASPVQKLATEIATSLNYLKLLILPHPLSADYSYNSIPYKDFAHWQVWLSILVHGAMIAVMGIFAFARENYKKLFAFAIGFYIFHLLLVNNLVFNIGATMGERLIFHSSVGFSIVLAYLLVTGAEKYAALQSKTVLTGVMAVLVVLCGIKTIARNADWKNDKTLFSQDIKVVPNSVLVLGNVAAALISTSDKEKDSVKKMDELHRAIGLLERATIIHPTFVAGYLNQGIAYYKLGVLDSAERCLDSVKKNYPNYPTLASLYILLGEYHMRLGWTKYGKFGKYPEAIVEFKLGIAIDSTNPELWYNLGGAYFSNRQPMEAVAAWQRTLKINPNHEQARAGMQAAYSIIQQNMGGAPMQQQQPAPPKSDLVPEHAVKQGR